MDFSNPYFWGPLVGGIVLYVIIASIVRAPGRMLQARFASLGTVAGRSKAQIISIVGPPTAISGRTDGNPGSLVQWQATGYHIALLFDANEICSGITHQFSVGGLTTRAGTPGAVSGWPSPPPAAPTPGPDDHPGPPRT